MSANFMVAIIALGGAAVAFVLFRNRDAAEPGDGEPVLESDGEPTAVAKPAAGPRKPRKRTHRLTVKSRVVDMPARVAESAAEGEREFRLAVHGESYRNADGSSRQDILRRCRIGEPVELVLEPDNPYDSEV